MKIRYLSMIAALFCGAATFAQSPQELKLPPTIYYMPDGKKIDEGKVDSVLQDWGPRAKLKKETFGYDSVVVQLIRQTDEMMDNSIADRKKEISAFSALLNAKAPDLLLTDMVGRKYTLSELKGKVVVLNFWFTTCVPCLQEMPELNKLKRTYAGKEVLFLGLTFNKQADVVAFQRYHQFDFILLPDSKATDRKYHVVGWPSTFVIDREGFIRFSQIGNDRIIEKLKASIDKALA